MSDFGVLASTPCKNCAPAVVGRMFWGSLPLLPRGAFLKVPGCPSLSLKFPFASQKGMGIGEESG